jgi:hypothetical protein
LRAWKPEKVTPLKMTLNQEVNEKVVDFRKLKSSEKIGELTNDTFAMDQTAVNSKPH